MTHETGNVDASYSEARGIPDAPEGRRASSPLSSAAGDTGERCAEDGPLSTPNDELNLPAIESAVSVSASGRALGSSANSQGDGNGKKRKRLDDSGQVKRVKTDRDGQSKLSSFFQGKPSAKSKSNSSKSKSDAHQSEAIEIVDDDGEEERFQRDLRLATMLSQTSSGGSPPATATTAVGAWTSLLGPLQPPNCSVHDEPAKMFTVNKPGPNKGKTFFVCSR